MMRFLAQGSMSLVSQTAINHWWVRRRGMALGFAGLVSSLLGTGTFPSLINWLIGMVGWRSSYQLLGLMVTVIMLPLGLALFRRPPETYGLEPDGGVVGTSKQKKPRPPPPRRSMSKTLPEARLSARPLFGSPRPGFPPCRC